MAAPMNCCIHIVSGENNTVLPISANCTSKIKECANKWKHLDGVQRVVAENLLETFEETSSLDRLGYHTQCYRRFTDKTKIERAIKRCAKHSNTNPDDVIATPPRKSARLSSNPSCSASQRQTSASKRNSCVLPEQCIICKGEKYIKVAHSRTRRREPLSKCEYESGKFVTQIHKIGQNENMS